VERATLSAGGLAKQAAETMAVRQRIRNVADLILKRHRGKRFRRN